MISRDAAAADVTDDVSSIGHEDDVDDAASPGNTLETKKEIQFNTSCRKLDLSARAHNALDAEQLGETLLRHDNPPGLHELTVRSKPRLETLPVVIGRFENLVTLTLSNNSLKDLPWSMLYLKNLQKLDLSRNQFQHIPRIIGYLVALRELNMTRNCLLTIPNEILKLEKLEKLDLSENKNLKGFTSGPFKNKKEVDSVFQIVRQRRLRSDLWCESRPWAGHDVSGGIPRQKSFVTLHELAVTSILTHHVDFLVFETVPPRIKTFLTEKAEEHRSRIRVAKCSSCKHFYSSKEMFENHVCQAG